MFGVEGILADELKRLNINNVDAQNGRVFFEGDENTVAVRMVKAAEDFLGEYQGWMAAQAQP